jgi:hypothetical protein
VTQSKGKRQMSENGMGNTPSFGCFGAKTGQNWSKKCTARLMLTQTDLKCRRTERLCESVFGISKRQFPLKET